MDIERVCFNCNYFMPDKKDFDTGYGACMFDMDKFEPFVDEIFEDNDFSSCMEAYDEKRIEGGSIVCENYEQVEIIEFDDNASPDEIKAEILISSLQNQSTEEFEKLLNGNVDEKRYAINELIGLLHIGNNMAYEALLNYFITSEPAKTLEEVHLRVKIIEALQFNANKKELVEHYINELLKTPSNNTTRKIYLSIFKYVERCDVEIVREPLMSYLNRSKCSPKIKSKVLWIIEKERNFFPF